jgi:hypothetical protein
MKRQLLIVVAWKKVAWLIVVAVLKQRKQTIR